MDLEADFDSGTLYQYYMSHRACAKNINTLKFKSLTPPEADIADLFISATLFYSGYELVTVWAKFYLCER